ncbi:GntR family transcriptional regulator [Spongiactinospora gelatinilytica]|uniref:GntR family transcriptional regulator n=1 Tax=Spongiactinospora gelatinilytica TaxID=2666298 RepID=A0A2W2G1C3_9ACTN|nr:FCD domain-containing protein [Spongiactinospora gelatinilytica]PZG43676.1 GntR family transcriptional regulator [Spongiactinospora gelatinilytica]
MEGLEAPHRSATMSAQLVNSLRAHIESGRWPVGTRIPPEHVLVEQLKVSRNTVREALRALVHLGLLEARVGDGTYVRAASELESVLVRRASAAREEEIFELRAILEEYAAGLAAARRSESKVGVLRRLLAAVEEANRAGEMAALAAADGEFHREVVNAGGNGLLAEVYAYLGTALTATLRAVPWDPEAAAEHARLHVRLVDAIEAGDEVAARHVASSVVRVTRRSAARTPAGAGE